ncbi:MAG: hypothetical protein ACTS73_02005 [Arsenophonus sp. NEOnobi-MAG3]
MPSVHNSYIPQRTIQTDIGYAEIKVLRSEIATSIEYVLTARFYRII